MKKSAGSILFVSAVFGLAACGNGTTTNNNTNINANRTANNVAVVVNSNSVMNTTNAANTVGNTSSALSDDDKKFMNEAAQGGMAEVKLGQLASEKAVSADVKAYGKKMVEDHTNANTELKAVAAKKGLTLPTEMNAEQKSDYDELSKLSGAEFDKKYVSMMVEDHEKDVADFKDQSEDGKDVYAKGFAAKTLPTLQKHLDMIKEIKGKMK